MVGPASPDGDEGISLLEFHGNGDRSWQLNFDDFQVSREHKEKKPPSKLHNCLGCLVSKNMEEAHSVNSPRRVLSFSKRKKQKQQPGFQDSDSTRPSPFRASQVQGPKPSEVYGFVGSISTVVATVIFLIWAYVPDKALESIGIHYYPSRYWVLAMPTYLMVTLLLALAFYIGLNFIATPPPTSLNTLFDEYSREPGEFDQQMEQGDERPINPISDISITRINHLMFNSSDVLFENWRSKR